MYFGNKLDFLCNLNKAYSAIGFDFSDVKLVSAICGIDEAEIVSILDEEQKINKTAAKELFSPYLGKRITSKPKKIAWLGDSLTNYRMSFRCIIQQALCKYPNFEYRDYSISGYKVSDLYSNFYPYISEFTPDIAIIIIGTNDIRITDDEYHYVDTPIEHYMRDLNYILKKLSCLGCESIIATLPPFDMKKISRELKTYKMLFKEETRTRYNSVISSAAAAHNARLVDMRGVYEKYDSSEITIEDGLHLNPDGHFILATEIMKKLIRLITE